MVDVYQLILDAPETRIAVFVPDQLVQQSSDELIRRFELYAGCAQPKGATDVRSPHPEKHRGEWQIVWIEELQLCALGKSEHRTLERSAVTQTPLLELLLDESPYSIDLIQGNGSKPFVSISGAKKGSRHKGGGIIIPDLRSLDCILGLIRVIGALAIPAQPAEEQVTFYTERTRFFSGETKLFNDQWFYRIKAYRNFFKDVETGTYIPLK